MSDHRPIIVNIDVKKKQSEKSEKFILKRSFKVFNKEEFLKDLAKMRWEYIGCENQSVHESAHIFNKMFEECLDKHAPIKKIKIHKHYKRGPRVQKSKKCSNKQN